MKDRKFGRLLSVILLIALLLTGCGKDPEPVRVTKELEQMSVGIDVAKYQGTIDWQEVRNAGIEFAIVRLGYRSITDGSITEDSNARYNMQEAQKYGVKLGAYFFSTAISEEEAVSEAYWVADVLSQYPITYPVVYDCEQYDDPQSRQYHLTKTERTDIALKFLETIEELGYEGMFYASKNQLVENTHWEVSRIETDYKIWVAQYPEMPYPATKQSSYEGIHHMWQYAMDGIISGIDQSVDLNLAYFSYDGVEPPKNQEPPVEVGPDPEALMEFHAINETVTAKSETNLRDVPSQGDDSTVLYTLKNGEEATRIGISDSGWSKVVLDGHIYYAVSSYLTTNFTSVAQYDDQSGLQTQFVEVDDRVTAKEVVNLRALPSVEHEDAVVIAQLKNGAVVQRTGINEDVGWSRVVYEGQTLYCVSSYLKVVE